MSRPPVHRDLLPLLALAAGAVADRAPGRRWTGTADALLDAVNAEASASCRARESWPATGAALAAALDRAGMQLRARRLLYRRSALGARPITLNRYGG